MRTLRSWPPKLRAFTPLIVAGVLAFAATTTAGFEPRPVRPIDDSAFLPVVLGGGNPGDAYVAGLAGPSVAPGPSFDLQPLADPLTPSAPPDRPNPPLPSPRRIVVEVPPPKPAADGPAAAANSIAGRASWYCNSDDPSGPMSVCHYAYPDGPGFDAYAAAGPSLRAAIGSGWRNTVVNVCGRQCVSVKLVDWCKCTGGSVGIEKLIDLYYDVYVRTGSSVTISW